MFHKIVSQNLNNFIIYYFYQNFNNLILNQIIAVVKNKVGFKMLSAPIITRIMNERCEKSVHFQMQPYNVGIRPPPVKIVIDNASDEESDRESEREYVERSLNKQNIEYLRSIFCPASIETCQIKENDC